MPSVQPWVLLLEQERVFSHNRFLSGVFRRSGQAARGLYVRIQLPPRVFGMVSRRLHQRCQRDGGSDGRLAHCGLCAGDERGRSGYLPRSGDPCGLCGMDVPRPFAGGADHSHAARMHPGAHHRRVRASGGSGNLATGRAWGCLDRICGVATLAPSRYGAPRERAGLRRIGVRIGVRQRGDQLQRAASGDLCALRWLGQGHYSRDAQPVFSWHQHLHLHCSSRRRTVYSRRGQGRTLGDARRVGGARRLPARRPFRPGERFPGYPARHDRLRRERLYYPGCGEPLVMGKYPIIR